jgi:DNA/RNA endonuclease G (NUC1)
LKKSSEQLNKKIKNKITIPDYYFKIAIILENGDFDMMRINDADIICVLMPNRNDISDNWKEYIVPLSKIKELAGVELPITN